MWRGLSFRNEEVEEHEEASVGHGDRRGRSRDGRGRGVVGAAGDLSLHEAVGTLAEGGTIDMQISNSRVTGDVQHFDATVQVDSSVGSFTSELSGTFNFVTYRTTLDGTVTSGWSAGSQVHEEGLLVDPNTYTFEGTLRVMSP